MPFFLKYIAILCLLCAVCYSLYSQWICPKNQIVFMGKKFKLPKEIRHMAIKTVYVKDDVYYATGTLDEDGRNITIEIDKTLMELIPSASGDESVEDGRIADVLVYEITCFQNEPNTIFALTPEEIRFKWDLSTKPENDKYLDTAIAYQVKNCAIYRTRNILLLISFVTAFCIPIVSLFVSAATVAMALLFVLPLGCTKPLNNGIIKQKEKVTSASNEEKTILDTEEELPTGFENWTDTLQYLWKLNKRVRRAADILLAKDGTERANRVKGEDVPLHGSEEEERFVKPDDTENVPGFTSEQPEEECDYIDLEEKGEKSEADAAVGVTDEDEGDPFADDSGIAKEFDPGDETNDENIFEKTTEFECDEESNSEQEKTTQNDEEPYLVEVLERESDDIEIIDNNEKNTKTRKNKSKKRKEYIDASYKELPQTQKKTSGNRRRSLTAEIFNSIINEEK